MTGSCPVCNSPWDHPQINIFGRIMANDRGAAFIGPVQTTVLKVLLEGPAHRRTLMEAAYGYNTNGPMSASNSLTVIMGDLREKLRPMGYTIQRIPPGTAGDPFYTLSPLHGEKPNGKEAQVHDRTIQ